MENSSRARDAFLQGMAMVAAVSAPLAIGLALLAVVMLRNVGPGGDSGVTADGPGGPERCRTSEPQDAGAGGV